MRAKVEETRQIITRARSKHVLMERRVRECLCRENESVKRTFVRE